MQKLLCSKKYPVQVLDAVGVWKDVIKKEVYDAEDHSFLNPVFVYRVNPATPTKDTTRNGICLDGEQFESMLLAAKPLIKWLNENTHPMCSLAVDHTSVQLFESIAKNRTEEFLKD
jgi:hypothetical protein